MSTLTCKYRGHDIAFDMASEEWQCGSLALANKSLANLKSAIDRESKKRRRVNVDVLYLREHWRSSSYIVKKATIVLLREGDRKADIRIAGERGQELVSLSELYPLDQKEKLDALVGAKKREQDAIEAAREMEEALEPITAEAVREAVAHMADEAA